MQMSTEEERSPDADAGSALRGSLESPLLGQRLV